MNTDFLPSLFSNIWTVCLIVIFFGGSIFVHELGHFLAARWRGVHVARFSIGFGPKIFSWTGKDGVEYRLSWLPLGGYVTLPQLSDMRAIEGEAGADVAKLPAVSYASRMIVFAAGAAFNVIFAFVLACVISVVGEPQSSQSATTKIGYVLPTIEVSDAAKDAGPIPGPALQAGLRIGDIVRAVNKEPVTDWNSMKTVLATSSGRSADGMPQAVFTIERAGVMTDFILHPRLSKDEGFRVIGISPDYELTVSEAPADSVGAQAGFKVGDEILDLDGVPMRNLLAYQNHLIANHARPVLAHVKRAGATIELTIPIRPQSVTRPGLGLGFASGLTFVYPSPFAQIGDMIGMTFRSLGSLINPHSDIGLSKMTGPVGIVRAFYDTAEADIRMVLMFTILINVNLGILNLLPIPVLDGGHILFATIGRLRGRALPLEFVMKAQGIFVVLLFSMILYLSCNDAIRWYGDSKAAAAAAAAAQAEGAK